MSVPPRHWPLAGKRVVVTRRAEQAGALRDRLVALGAEVVEMPVIALRDPADGGAALARAAAAVDHYAWVVLTSPNGAERFARAWRQANPGATWPTATRIAAIGPGTAAALAEHHLHPHLLPADSIAEGLLAAFPPPPSDGGRVLLARAAVARDVLPDGLRAAGWDVDVVVAYRTVTADPAPPALRAEAAAADAVTFTSSSTVEAYLAVAGATSLPPRVVCIGPVTAATARSRGIEVTSVAARHDLDGLVEAVVASLA